MSAFSILAFEVRVNLPIRSGSDFESYEIGMVLGSLSNSLMRLDDFYSLRLLQFSLCLHASIWGLIATAFLAFLSGI